jgi:hypothetical protein
MFTLLLLALVIAVIATVCVYTISEALGSEPIISTITSLPVRQSIYM